MPRKSLYGVGKRKGKRHLSICLGRSLNIGRERAGEILEIVGNALAAELARGVPIRFPVIGTFYPIPEQKRLSYNPVSRQKEQVTFRPTIKFKPSVDLRGVIADLKETHYEHDRKTK